MSKHSFMKLAQDARAVYKINRITLVNVKILRSIWNLFGRRHDKKEENELLYIKKHLTF